MPSRRKQSAPFTPAEIAAAVKSNPYLQRLVLDAKLRDNMRTTADSIRNVYERVSNGKVSARSLLEDRKAQADLRKALENLRDVTLAVTAPPKKRRKLRLGRLLVLLGIGSGVALAASESFGRRCSICCSAPRRSSSTRLRPRPPRRALPQPRTRALPRAPPQTPQPRPARRPVRRRARRKPSRSPGCAAGHSGSLSAPSSP